MSSPNVHETASRAKWKPHAQAQESRPGASAALKPNPAETERFLHVVNPDAGVLELRIPKTAEGTRYGFFSDYSLLAQEAARRSGDAPGIYATINCISKQPRNQTAIASRNSLTSDADVAHLSGLLIDLDTKRKRDTSSTDAEHKAATERAGDIEAWLKEEQGWPDPVVIDSGNGAHLRYRINLPNTRENVDLIRRCLKALAERFDDDVVNVDVTCHNPSRIAKLPGTAACKGESTPERPHRLARILKLPERLEPVSLEQLAHVAVPAENCGKPPGSEGKWHRAKGAGPDDEEVPEEFIKAFESNPLLKRLWDGDSSGYGSPSQADLALCNILSHICGYDPRRVDELFRRSALMREKWNRDDYRERTLAKACTRPASAATEDLEWLSAQSIFRDEGIRWTDVRKRAGHLELDTSQGRTVFITVAQLLTFKSALIVIGDALGKVLAPPSKGETGKIWLPIVRRILSLAELKRQDSGDPMRADIQLRSSTHSKARVGRDRRPKNNTLIL